MFNFKDKLKEQNGEIGLSFSKNSIYLCNCKDKQKLNLLLKQFIFN